MLKVGLIPLDSRPCNTNWLEDLAKVAGVKLISYPFKDCGNLHQGANLDQQLAWIQQNYAQLDYLVISADGLCSGGLIQARLGQIDAQQVIQKLAIFKEIKEKKPTLKIYVFDTLMRTSITAYDNETAHYWSKVNEYSLYKGRVHFFHNEEDKIKLAQLEKEIPTRIIDTYLRARNVKHTLNRYFVECMDLGFIDYLILLQEDSMPMGIQKIEQTILDEMISHSAYKDQIMVYNGTDEGGVILLAKAILDDLNLAPKLHLVLPSLDVLDHTMLFEDRSFSINLHKMLETLHMTLVDNPLQADFNLAIYAEHGNKDLDLSSTAPVLPSKDQAYVEFIHKVNQLIKQKTPTCFVDLLFPNGGSVEILEEIDYKNLTCYSAWNTASNTMGSALANIACYIVGSLLNQEHYQHENSFFTKERILDDCLFQYVSRRKFNEAAIQSKINIFDLKEYGKQATFEIENDLKEVSKKYLNDAFTLELPWNRTFEALIKVKRSD